MLITSVKNFFGIGRVKDNGDLKGSSYRLIRRDIMSSVTIIEKSINTNMDRRHFAAQRKRVEILLEVCDRSENLMQQLLWADTEHNTFRVRYRIEKLKDFLVKYQMLLNSYNDKFLEKIHHAIEFSSCDGLVTHENLIIKEDGKIEIIK